MCTLAFGSSTYIQSKLPFHKSSIPAYTFPALKFPLSCATFQQVALFAFCSYHILDQLCMFALQFSFLQIEIDKVLTRAAPILDFTDTSSTKHCC